MVVLRGEPSAPAAAAGRGLRSRDAVGHGNFAVTGLQRQVWWQKPVGASGNGFPKRIVVRRRDMRRERAEINNVIGLYPD